ncbi:hypothetical protein E2C01_091775 [Portunus trituberculatus]|uniref:Uncharacterized protein n=1 Tax=Portunus trituberculatus TaxID=210409 RepID=A0A5B7JJX2_PORTR|nr:hypothetical protein [Portunus trituberculatus]
MCDFSEHCSWFWPPHYEYTSTKGNSAALAYAVMRAGDI